LKWCLMVGWIKKQKEDWNWNIDDEEELNGVRGFYVEFECKFLKI
jgi:hypothetical protein